MYNATATKTNAITELEPLLKKAMEKIGVDRENGLCPYLPATDDEGRLHHFTLKKMKENAPNALADLITENILDKEAPKAIPSKPRLRITKGKAVKLSLKQEQISELLAALKGSNNIELIKELSAHRSLKSIQREMIQMVKEKKVDASLWETYTQLVTE